MYWSGMLATKDRFSVTSLFIIVLSTKRVIYKAEQKQRTHLNTLANTTQTVRLADQRGDTI